MNSLAQKPDASHPPFATDIEAAPEFGGLIRQMPTGQSSVVHQLTDSTHISFFLSKHE
jgi:hypothetical protein